MINHVMGWAIHRFVAAYSTAIAIYHYRKLQTLRNRLEGVDFVPISAYFYLLTKNIHRSAELAVALPFLFDQQQPSASIRRLIQH